MDKRTAILESARKLLVREGFNDDAVALDDVARAAKVAKGTLFLYYKNKEELLRAAFSDLVESLGAELDGLSGSPLRGQARLAALVKLILSHFERNRDFLGQVARFPCGALADNHARVVKLLEACASDGLFAPRELAPRASMLFGLCRSAILYKKITGVEEPEETRSRRVVDFFLYGAAGSR
jgi:AcrR family transcriptional regulator